MTQVHLVWAATGSTRTVLHVFTDLLDARRFVDRAERHEHDEQGYPEASACELLDVRLWIETIEAKESRREGGGNPMTHGNTGGV